MGGGKQGENMSRPTKYNPEEHPKLARQLTGMGKTQADMAEAFDVVRSTIQIWIEEHPEFSVAIKLGREDATDRVERALLERATGYTLDVEKPMVVSGGKDCGSTIEMVPIKVHYPSDTAAASMWLRNRRPSEWKDKQYQELSGTLSLEQLMAQTVSPAKKEEDRS